MATNFSVSPMSQNVALVPGGTTEGSITVVNPSDATSDFKYRIEILPFNMTEDGQIDTETVGAYSQMVHWISIPEGMGTVPPNGTKKVEFNITVPEDAPGGSQAAAIVVVPEISADEAEGVQVLNSFPIASVIYATVAGETHHDTAIVGSELPGFTLSPPVSATARLANNGNTYETADVTITATNLITGEKILEGGKSEDGREKNVFSEVVMPGSTRDVSRTIDGLPVAGIVRVEQTVEYGGESQTVSSNLVICPVWLMVLIAAAILAAIGGAMVLIRRRKLKRLGI